jgi:tetratricopeptide (TPR) repeat protein
LLISNDGAGAALALSAHRIIFAPMAVPKTLLCLLAAALLATPGHARAAEEESGNFIEIPGFGRIPLPPSHEPDEEPALRKAPKKPAQAAKPAKKLTPAQVQAKVTDELAARLQAASDSSEAEAIMGLLRQSFANATSDTAALIATRAATAEKAGAPALALTLLDRLVAIDPAWSEGFVDRAQLRLVEGDAAGARADFEAALRLEPRRFDALMALGSLKEEADDKKGALDAYRRALALAPKLESLRRTEQRLRVEVEGRDI